MFIGYLQNISADKTALMKTKLFLFFQLAILFSSGAQSLTLESFSKNAPQRLPHTVGYVPLRNDPAMGTYVAAPLFNARPSPKPYAFNAAALPFFCKIEYDMMKGKKLPLKFRLGDVEYVDELENKRSSNNPK